MAAFLLSARRAPVCALLAFVVLDACATVSPRRPTRPDATVRPPVGAVAEGLASPANEPPPVALAGARPPEPAVPAPGAFAPRDDDGALTAKIDRATPPGRAAALRLTEQARALLARDEAPRAIELLERAVAVDARAPYAYYFLAEAHERVGHGALACSFLARAEQLFAADAYWLGRVHALHGRIAEEEGRSEEARQAYARALAAWPQNGDAATGLARLDASGQGAP